MKKKILWLLQSNQFTPTMVEFFSLLQTRMEKLIDLRFLVPDTSTDILEKITTLNPQTCTTTLRSATKSYQGYQAKRDILKDTLFTHGLSVADVLVLDDLGGGNVIQTTLDLKLPEKTHGLILQIPTPLGSSEAEERMYQAAIMWARHNRIPSIGYELLPLDTKWSLAPSLPDGVIARTLESFVHLKEVLDHTNLWLLPHYEASILSSVSSRFNTDGVRAAYHYRSHHQIPESRTILYLPHNVAMIYEYQELLRIIAPMGKHLHLMFGYGEDQVRGAHTQKEMIDIIYKKELAQFASYSFHNSNSPWEMMMADCMVACSPCFQTTIAQEKNISSIVFDPIRNPMTQGFNQRVNTETQLQEAINQVIENHRFKLEFGSIFMELANTRMHHDN
jgi:hypothetical protein